MFCEWCAYDFSEEGSGYSLINGEDNTIPGKYCSLNCCIAQIEMVGVDCAIRKQKLYEYYSLHIEVEPAKSPSKLIKNGGTLNYYQYRYGFICPSKYSPTQNCDYLEDEEYYEEEDYDS
jgi:hypothetical protein